MSYYSKAGMIDPKYVAKARRQIEETGEPYFGSPTKADSTRLGKMMATATPTLVGAPRTADVTVTAIRDSGGACALVCIDWSDDTGYTWRDHLESRYDLEDEESLAKALSERNLDESELDDDIPGDRLVWIDPDRAVQSRIWSAFDVLRPIFASPFFVASSTKEAPPAADVDLGRFYHVEGDASSLLAVSLLHYCITALGSEITLEYAESYPDL